MDVVWISHFGEGQQSILAADGDPVSLALIADESWPVITSLYVKVLAQQGSPVVSQNRRQPAGGLPGLEPALGVAVLVCVPLIGEHSRVIGTMCCLRRIGSPNGPEQADEVQPFMELMSEPVIAHLQSPAATAQAGRLAETARIRSILRHESFRMVFQPVVRLPERIPVAYEALARFEDAWFPTPAHVFLAAERAGLGVGLELLAVRRAFDRLPALPPAMWLGVNLSARALLVPEVQDLLLSHAGDRVGIEVTEHAEVDDYDELTTVTDRLRSAGIQVGVDDAGAGYASFRHILKLRPSIIKLDLEIVRDIDTDPARQALTRSFVTFAEQADAFLVAEGVETEAESRMLQDLGVSLAQGYFFGRPQPLEP